jgi:anti-anti-sigma factor
VTAPVEIALERLGGTVIAHVGGEIDMTNAGHVRDELLESIPNDALALVIELERCRYLDSAGIDASSTCRDGSAGAARTCGSCCRRAHRSRACSS